MAEIYFEKSDVPFNGKLILTSIYENDSWNKLDSSIDADSIFAEKITYHYHDIFLGKVFSCQSNGSKTIYAGYLTKP